jgi:hypothetical protein
MDAEHSGQLRNVHSGPIMSTSGSIRIRNSSMSPGYHHSDSSARVALSNQI